LQVPCYRKRTRSGWRSSAGAGILVKVIDRTFSGAMSLDMDMGLGVRRLNGSLGTAQIRITEGGVWLGAWSKAIPKDLGSVAYRREDVAEVFRTKSLLFAWLAPGIGIATADGKTHYFGTFRAGQVLAALRETGYPIGKSRRPRGVIRGQFPWPRGAGD
jgi:hypothetical protein